MYIIPLSSSALSSLVINYSTDGASAISLGRLLFCLINLCKIYQDLRFEIVSLECHPITPVGYKFFLNRRAVGLYMHIFVPAE